MVRRRSRPADHPPTSAQPRTQRNDPAARPEFSHAQNLCSTRQHRRPTPSQPVGGSRLRASARVGFSAQSSPPGRVPAGDTSPERGGVTRPETQRHLANHVVVRLMCVGSSHYTRPVKIPELGRRTVRTRRTSLMLALSLSCVGGREPLLVECIPECASNGSRVWPGPCVTAVVEGTSRRTPRLGAENVPLTA